jgi:thiol-disulfide isomerase/thioredoxin
MRYFFLLLLTLFSYSSLLAIDGYEIKVNIKNYEQNKLILAHYMASTILVDDTATISENGNFVFNGEKDLAAGIYLLVMPPENKYIEVFLTETEKKYSVQFDATTLTKDIEFKNAPDNALFYEYLHFMEQKRPALDELVKKIQEGRKAKKEVAKEEQEVNKLKKEIEKYKKTLIETHPKKLTSTILKSNLEIENPIFEGTTDEIRFQEYMYRRHHFFDNVRSDPRFFRTKICNEMINYYLDQLTPIHPDSINYSVDQVLDLVSPDSNAFKTYFYNLINKYLQSEYMGMEAVYVHLVKEYTMKGRTNFFSEETNAKLTKDALIWEKTLIGKIAPDLEMFKLNIEQTIKVKDHEDVNRRFALDGKTYMKSITKPYTVLVFWAPDCGHCKKSMPVLVDFYEKHQDSVEVFAVCHTQFKEYPACAEALKNYKAIKWINTVDPYYKYIKDYDIQTTPLILLLDADKKVRFKKIAAEKLEMALEQMKMEKENLEK